MIQGIKVTMEAVPMMGDTKALHKPLSWDVLGSAKCYPRNLLETPVGLLPV